MATNLIDRPENKEALALWHKVMQQSVHTNSYDLSARQMAVLLTLHVVEGQHTVRGLSEHLSVSKPAICRALDALSRHGLAQRSVDQQDRRNVYIHLTDEGILFLGDFSEKVLTCLMEIV